MKVQILTDNPESWIVEPTSAFVRSLIQEGIDAKHFLRHEEITPSDILVMLGCEKILSREHRAINRHNLVVHESAVPQGKGWSPLTWQILEGKSEVPVTLLEATDKVDSGVVYYQEILRLKGNELIDELRQLQAKASFGLIRKFLKNYPHVTGIPQQGEETFYARRTAKDSKLDPSRSIEEQFNLLRVVDNERYPAFFTLRGRTYRLKIEAIE